MSKNTLSSRLTKREIFGVNKQAMRILAQEMIHVLDQQHNTLLHRAALEVDKVVDKGKQAFYKNLIQLGGQSLCYE
jgi:hypothetical protein